MAEAAFSLCLLAQCAVQHSFKHRTGAILSFLVSSIPTCRGCTPAVMEVVGHAGWVRGNEWWLVYICDSLIQLLFMNLQLLKKLFSCFEGANLFTKENGGCEGRQQAARDFLLILYLVSVS